MDPYFIIRFDKQSFRSSKVVLVPDTNPLWEEAFVFDVSNPLSHHKNLKIDVYNQEDSFFDMFPTVKKDMMHSTINDIPLGSIQIPLHGFIPSSSNKKKNTVVLDFWMSLQGVASGEVRIVSFFHRPCTTSINTSCPLLEKNRNTDDYHWILNEYLQKQNNNQNQWHYDTFGLPIPNSDYIEWQHLRSYTACRHEYRRKEWSLLKDKEVVKSLETMENPGYSRRMLCDLAQTAGGIPHSYRKMIYMHLSGANEFKQRKWPGYYQNLVELTRLVKSKSIRQIELDIHRTLGKPCGRSDAYMSSKKASLLRILSAFSECNTDVGYCQGMNFLVAFFLLFLDEEDAFWMLIAVCEKLFKGYHTPSMFGSRIDLLVLRECVKERLPVLNDHLDRLHVPLEVLGSQVRV